MIQGLTFEGMGVGLITWGNDSPPLGFWIFCVNQCEHLKMDAIARLWICQYVTRAEELGEMGIP